MLKKQGIICQTEPNEWILTYNLGNLTILTRTSRNLIFFSSILLSILSWLLSGGSFKCWCDLISRRIVCLWINQLNVKNWMGLSSILWIKLLIWVLIHHKPSFCHYNCDMSIWHENLCNYVDSYRIGISAVFLSSCMLLLLKFSGRKRHLSVCTWRIWYIIQWFGILDTDIISLLAGQLLIVGYFWNLLGFCHKSFLNFYISTASTDSLTWIRINFGLINTILSVLRLLISFLWFCLFGLQLSEFVTIHSQLFGRNITTLKLHLHVQCRRYLRV